MTQCLLATWQILEESSLRNEQFLDPVLWIALARRNVVYQYRNEHHDRDPELIETDISPPKATDRLRKNECDSRGSSWWM